MKYKIRINSSGEMITSNSENIIIEADDTDKLLQDKNYLCAIGIGREYIFEQYTIVGA